MSLLHRKISERWIPGSLCQQKLYTDILPGHALPIRTLWKTTTQTIKGFSYNNRLFPTMETSQSSGGSYSFGNIYSCNYFEKVLPEFEAGTISGAEEKIRQYIGEMYFMRILNISNASVHTVISLLSRLPYPTKWEPLVEPANAHHVTKWHASFYRIWIPPSRW